MGAWGVKYPFLLFPEPSLRSSLHGAARESAKSQPPNRMSFAFDTLIRPRSRRQPIAFRLHKARGLFAEEPGRNVLPPLH
jgi:hypothetical protein